MRSGDKITFEVEGPVNTSAKRCDWDVEKQCAGYGSAPVGTNRFEFQTDPEGEPTNRITVTCRAEALGIEKGEQGTFIVWDTRDVRKWEIRVLQDTRPVWDGTYVIRDDTDLHLLEGYSSITGNLYIGDIRNLTDLSCLHNLVSVGGDFLNCNNDDLTDLSGLENLVSIGWELRISDNAALTSLSGMEKLTRVGSLNISKNNSLTSLGMTSLKAIDGYFRIYYNRLPCTSLAEGLRDHVLAGEGTGGQITISGNKDCMAQ